MPRTGLKAQVSKLAVEKGAARRGGAEGGARPDAERIRVLKDYATRAAQQKGGALIGTVHCELLDYYATIVLQMYFAAVHAAAPLPPPFVRDDLVDIAKGYHVDVLRIFRPKIPAERVIAHAGDAYLQLRKIAAQRSAPARRALADGAEQYDKAEKLGSCARGCGGAPPDSDHIRVLKDYATCAAQQKGDALIGTVCVCVCVCVCVPVCVCVCVCVCV